MKLVMDIDVKPYRVSRPARGAWIETISQFTWLLHKEVAPRTGRVD